jgi:hypothetical protein
MSSANAVDAFVVATALEFDTAVIASGDAADLDRLTSRTARSRWCRSDFTGKRAAQLSSALQWTMDLATLGCLQLERADVSQIPRDHGHPAENVSLDRSRGPRRS